MMVVRTRNTTFLLAFSRNSCTCNRRWIKYLTNFHNPSLVLNIDIFTGFQNAGKSLGWSRYPKPSLEGFADTYSSFPASTKGQLISKANFEVSIWTKSEQ